MAHRTLRFAGYPHPPHAAWLRLLLLSLLAQLLLPVQVHSQWRIDDKGRPVELCTLQGVRLMRMDPDSGQPLPAAVEQGHSPAMAFSDLLLHAAVASPALPRVDRHRQILPVLRSQLPATPVALLPRAGIRGPPVMPA